MNCLSKILAVIGAITMYGAITENDYMYELHRNYPMSQMLIQIVIGFSLVIPMLIIERRKKND